jgi:hypothetical protein
MSLPNEVNLHHLGSTGYNINQSLRFRSAIPNYLTRTPGSAGNRRIFTFSCWVKRGNDTGRHCLFSAGTSSGGGGPGGSIYFNTSGGNYKFEIIGAGGTSYQIISEEQYRDTTAWYHIVVAFDTTQATDTNRIKMYVNNVATTFTGSYPGSSFDTDYNNTAVHAIGSRTDDSYTGSFDGHMTEVYMIDGQQLTPSSFGETDSETGVWKPKKYSGTYGTNGFYLNFSDNASTTTLGYDKSGNNNNFTTSGVSLTTGYTYDWMRDSPTLSALASNHCTLNALNKYSGSTVRSGGLQVVHGSSGDGWCTTGSTMAFPPTGKWYAEFYITSRAFSGSVGIGISQATRSFVSQSGDTARFAWGRVYFDNASTFIGPSNATTGSVTNYTTGDTIGLAFDSDNGRVWWSKNGTWYGTGGSPDPATGTSPAYTGLTRASYTDGFVATCEGYSSSTVDANFGQRAFTYTPPSGFKALNAFNLPTPTIGATSATRANKNFDINLYTGTSATQTITNAAGFQSSLQWFKSRSNSTNNVLHDVLRGTAGINRLFSDSASAQSTTGDGFISINSNGFTLDGTGSGGDVNASGRTYVAWQWAGPASGTTNTDGSITSQVAVNQTAGFSVVTYTGTNTVGATVGHGLGVAPQVIFTKQTNAADSWNCYHVSLGASQAIFLNQDAAPTVASSFWNNTTPSSTVMTFGNAGTNQNNNVAYCWTPIVGYSSFGSYVGNGSSDGPYICTGFRPRFILVKSTSGSRNWYIWDTARNTYNVMNRSLYPNSMTSEITASDLTFDSLANGFKARGTSIGINNNGEEYIYMAFAETPFKYALAR